MPHLDSMPRPIGYSIFLLPSLLGHTILGSVTTVHLPISGTCANPCTDPYHDMLMRTRPSPSLFLRRDETGTEDRLHVVETGRETTGIRFSLPEASATNRTEPLLSRSFWNVVMLCAPYGSCPKSGPLVRSVVRRGEARRSERRERDTTLISTGYGMPVDKSACIDYIRVGAVREARTRNVVCMA